MFIKKYSIQKLKFHKRILLHCVLKRRKAEKKERKKNWAEGGNTSKEAVVVLLDSWGMSKEYEESSGSTTELAAPYESSSLLSWKVMLSYLVGERRQRVAIGSYMFLVGSARRAGLSIIKRSEFFLQKLILIICHGFKSKPNFARWIQKETECTWTLLSNNKQKFN